MFNGIIAEKQIRKLSAWNNMPGEIKMSTNVNLAKYLAMSWHFSVTPSEWEGKKGYWACVSELPNCSTFAKTQSEALSTVAQLLPTYLKIALESKADIPVPEGRDPAADDAGGTIV